MGRHLLRREALSLLCLALAALSALPGSTQPLASRVAVGEEAGRLGRPGRSVPAQVLPPRHLRGVEAEYVLPVAARLQLPEVQASLEGILRNERRALATTLERSLLFRGFIAQRVKERGLPPELVFLPVLESAYRVSAVSRSGAVGLWQIMDNTAGPLGLRLDQWVDERRDFWRASEAALTKLEDNRRRLGDWDLALAAYNSGLGALERIIQSAGVRDYWELRRRGLLSPETAAFVPRFYALTAICSQPGRYGLAVSWQPAQLWQRLELERSVELALLAQAAGIPAELLQVGNAELRTPVTPPGGPKRLLKVPAEAAGRVATLLADPQAPLLLYGYHTIRSGDTLYGLALAHGLAVELLTEANPGLDPRRLRIGTLLRIPLLGDSRATGLQEAEAPFDAALFQGQYTVRVGDTLWAIAREFATTAEELARANRRSLDDILKPGETLKVPVKTAGGALQ
jgi:membrane-bound lytic murein transglycosylase D